MWFRSLTKKCVYWWSHTDHVFSFQRFIKPLLGLNAVTQPVASNKWPNTCIITYEWWYVVDCKSFITSTCLQECFLLLWLRVWSVWSDDRWYVRCEHWEEPLMSRCPAPLTFSTALADSLGYSRLWKPVWASSPLAGRPDWMNLIRQYEPCLQYMPMKTFNTVSVTLILPM